MTDPHVTATTDQLDANLRDLVAATREHQEAWACPPPCLGRFVGERIAAMPHPDLVRLLGAALNALVAAGHGLPRSAEAYTLTEQARRLLDGGGSDG